MKHASSPASSAFTLVEMLAVIVIASLVVTMAGVGLSNVGGQASFMRTLAALEQLDARGRMHARTGGAPVAMVIDESCCAQLLMTTGRSTAELAHYDFGPAIAVTLEIADGEEQQVVFNRLGASCDYTMTLRDEQRQVRMEIAGLTGGARVREVLP